MICSSCGWENSQASAMCSRCGKKLPSGSGGPPRLTNRLTMLEMIVDNFKKRQITTEEYQQSLREMREFFTTQLDEVKAIEIPSDMVDEMKAEMEMGLLGIETFIASVDILQKFTQSHDTRLLGEGLGEARKANDFLNTALTMNWKNYQAFNESTEEYMRSTGYNS